MIKSFDWSDFWHTDSLDNKVQCHKRGISIVKFKCKYVLNNILYLSIFQQINIQFCFDFYTFIFWLFSTETLQVLMFVCHTVSELRFLWMLSYLFYITYLLRHWIKIFQRWWKFRQFLKFIIFQTHISLKGEGKLY